MGIDDRLRYRDPFAIETSLSTRTRLASEVTLALAGVEARLAPGLFGRLEAAVGGGDRGALLRVVYLPGRSGNHPEQPTEEESARIAAQLQKVRTEIETTIGEEVALETLLELLDRWEKEILEALPYPKYAALRDLVTYRFQQARDDLRSGSATAGPPSPSRAVLAAFAPQRAEPDSQVSRVLKRLGDFVGRLWTLADHNDFAVDLCVKTEPVQGAIVDLHPFSYKNGGGRLRSNDRLPLIIGLYAYRVSKGGYAVTECPPGGSMDCGLDLLSHARPLVRCRLSATKGDPDAVCVVTDEPPGSRDCKSP